MQDVLIIVAPVFLVIFLGFFLGKTPLFGEQDAAVLIRFVWYVGIPALLFRTLAPRELPGAEEFLIVAAYYLSLYGVYGLALLVARLFGQPPIERPVFAFVTCFGNGAFLGIPLLEATYGEEGVRLLMTILSFHTLTLLPLSTVLLERARSRGTSAPSILSQTFKDLRDNPIIITLIIGLSWAALGLPFPYWLDRVLNFPAAAAAPVALFAVGLSMSNVVLAGDIKQSATIAFLKLFVLPGLVYTLSRFVFQLPDVWVGTATITAALPAGMVAYSFATRYNVAVRRAASAVLISTGTAVISLSALLLFLGVGG